MFDGGRALSAGNARTDSFLYGGERSGGATTEGSGRSLEAGTDFVFDAGLMNGTASARLRAGQVLSAYAGSGARRRGPEYKEG